MSNFNRIIKTTKESAGFWGTFTTLTGVIADFCSPLIKLVPFLLAVAILSLIALTIIFYVKQYKIWKLELANGKMSKEAYDEKISSSGLFRSTCNLGLVTAVLLLFFSAQSVFAEDNKGFIASEIPTIADLQKRILHIEEDVSEIKETTARIDQKTTEILKNMKRVYTLSELQTLAKQELWQEVFDHLNDIEPLARSEAWNELLEQSALRLIPFLEFKIENGDAKLDQIILKTYPTLKNSPDFMTAWSKKTLKEIQGCYSAAEQINGNGYDTCSKFLEESIQLAGDNYEYTMSAAKMARLNMFAYNSMPYFHMAFQQGAPPDQCADSDLELAVIASLGLPQDDERVKMASEIGFDTCWIDLKKEILNELKASPTGYFHDNVCPHLKLKKIPCKK